MGIIKDRNSKDVKEGDENKKMEKEYTKLYKKKVFMTWINTTVWSFILSQTSWTMKSRGPYQQR